MDWGQASVVFDDLRQDVAGLDLASESEAQTRFHVIDRLIREVLGWSTFQVRVEERTTDLAEFYVDYTLRSGDFTIIVEAKKDGTAFPTPTSRTRLSLTGSVLTQAPIARAIEQAENYAHHMDTQAIVVTNGQCWCCFAPNARETGDLAIVLFPFANANHAEHLWDLLAQERVRESSLSAITQAPPVTENRLISELRQVDGRLHRNSIADHVVPALNRALYADAILSDPEQLRRCFVPTEARARFDSLLQMYLADIKPEDVKPARRLKTDKNKGEIHDLVESGIPQYAPPVTLIVGPVGAGKSTYLSHFQHVAGKEVLGRTEAHWVYVDFEHMGPSAEPRQFLYAQLLEYVNTEQVEGKEDYRSLVEPAYEKDIAALAMGPLAPIFKNKALFDQKISEFIQRDYERVEPYVDKIFKYLANKELTVIVLDNIDLYENEDLEATVFAEGLAFSKRIQAHVIVSLRDTTFVKHRTDSVFDAYELRKLWLDPPPFKQVLSRRLAFSRTILQDREARIASSGGSQIVVEDLGDFFEIVRDSLLSGKTGDFLDAVSDANIRKGLTLVTNFLTSGHIQADRALRAYMESDRGFRFPFHEAFKGAMLAQWRHFREDRSECTNLFDARLGSRSLRLLRLHLLRFLLHRARHKETLETTVGEILDFFGFLGASPVTIDGCVQSLRKAGLIRMSLYDAPDRERVLVISRSGGYYAQSLCFRLVYVEECMHDTAIDKSSYWETLCDLTEAIESEHDVPARMRKRKERLLAFLDYLTEIEKECLSKADGPEVLSTIPGICKAVEQESDRAIRQSDRWYGN